ncbi:LysR substrate-binding domain-containing protein [Xinfangfangia sp. CPCC 101601]|uniref:LysR substrate-binding domain-containing protein n=1 Tax=Pseudogemmobacter lacusdianii TaxID=3069608 RepID=A0ABU0W1B6_9RHOB|nr:LysR substrate-binding domain-containing protein [Xinfangfangia sp. CPCC 101601]MDQ2067807.1 LysR substrate-binding domain-containing protein [Xinfangfangia sp. CPCC 101601]
MDRMLNRLPSTRVLLIFESAARLGSFTRAAAELHMQQPSVSAAIKQLEDILGVQLFNRGHRRVALTTSGERLYTDVSKALADIESSLSTIRDAARNQYVTLSSSSAFSYYWLMPRLGSLRALHPEIDLRMQISIREPDLEPESIHLAIRLGNGNWPGCDSARIADEVIFPVASPQVMARTKPLRSVEDLLNERLIHLEEPIRERPSWSKWFAHHGVSGRDSGSGLRLNDYALVLQAAASGEGFAFGWQHVVQNLIDRKMLVPLSDWSWRTGNGIYLVWSKNERLSAQTIAVRDWIISVSDYPDGFTV